MKRRILGTPRDRTSAYIHFLGVALAIAALVLLVVFGAKYGTAWHVTTYAIFGASMILLYLASSFYHLFFISDKVHALFRKIDHMMIYVLIAGTYTPICLLPLRGALGWTMFGCIWGFALGGILMKAFWMKAPRWLSTLFYIGMGWVAVFAAWPLSRELPLWGLLLLFGGGVFYTIGGVCYALKWPPLDFHRFGFHELFHIFILLGTMCHMAMMASMLV